MFLLTMLIVFCNMGQESKCATSCRLDKIFEQFNPPSSSAPRNTCSVPDKLNTTVWHTFPSKKSTMKGRMDGWMDVGYSFQY